MTPVADHYADIARRLRELERERQPAPEPAAQEAEQEEMDWVGAGW